MLGKRKVRNPPKTSTFYKTVTGPKAIIVHCAMCNTWQDAGIRSRDRCVNNSACQPSYCKYCLQLTPQRSNLLYKKLFLCHCLFKRLVKLSIFKNMSTPGGIFTQVFVKNTYQPGWAGKTNRKQQHQFLSGDDWRRTQLRATVLSEWTFAIKNTTYYSSIFITSE